MDVNEFRIKGKEMVDYICEYLENLSSRRVTPNIEPGYLKPLLPRSAPQLPESWESIMQDVEHKIMPGGRLVAFCGCFYLISLKVSPTGSILVSMHTSPAATLFLAFSAICFRLESVALGFPGLRVRFALNWKRS